MAKAKKTTLKGKAKIKKGTRNGNVLWASLDPKKGNMTKLRIKAAKENLSICALVDQILDQAL